MAAAKERRVAAAAVIEEEEECDGADIRKINLLEVNFFIIIFKYSKENVLK